MLCVNLEAAGKIKSVVTLSLSPPTSVSHGLWANGGAGSLAGQRCRRLAFVPYLRAGLLPLCLWLWLIQFWGKRSSYSSAWGRSTVHPPESSCFRFSVYLSFSYSDCLIYIYFYTSERKFVYFIRKTKTREISQIIKYILCDRTQHDRYLPKCFTRTKRFIKL